MSDFSPHPLPYADPYSVFGLRGNPFLAEQQSGVDASLWIARDFPSPPLPRARRFVQLIGPKGAGKTSLLLHWQAIHAGPYYYVPVGPRRWLPPPLAPLVYWDELDRLAAPVRCAALLAACALGTTIVAGTHTDLTALARHCGFTVETFHFAPLTPTILRQWASLRIAAARLPGSAAPVLELDEATAVSIAAQAGASWRAAAVLLHIWVAELVNGTASRKLS